MSSRDIDHWTVYLMALEMWPDFTVSEMVRETLWSEGALRPRLEGLVRVGLLARHRIGRHGRIRYRVAQSDRPIAYEIVQQEWPPLTDEAEQQFAVPAGADKPTYKSIATMLDILVKSGRLRRSSNGLISPPAPSRADD